MLLPVFIPNSRNLRRRLKSLHNSITHKMKVNKASSSVKSCLLKSTVQFSSFHFCRASPKNVSWSWRKKVSLPQQLRIAIFRDKFWLYSRVWSVVEYCRVWWSVACRVFVTWSSSAVCLTRCVTSILILAILSENDWNWVWYGKKIITNRSHVGHMPLIKTCILYISVKL